MHGGSILIEFTQVDSKAHSLYGWEFIILYTLGIVHVITMVDEGKTCSL